MSTTPQPKHPAQAIYVDAAGTARFRVNSIVRWLLDSGPHDMNRVALERFDVEDRQQFAQLIGYSINGYNELSYAESDPRNAEYVAEANRLLAEAWVDPERAEYERLRKKFEGR